MSKIHVSVNKTVNYIFHLQAVAKINYNNDYSEKYKNTVSEHDLLILQDSYEELTFGNGYAGIYVNLFIFSPCYIINNSDELKIYFNLLKQAVEQNEYQVFYNKFKSHFDKLENWGFTVQGLRDNIVKLNEKHKINAMKLADVFINNYERYEPVWVSEKAKIKEKAKILNVMICKLDFIKKWEKYTNLKFKLTPYHIILCSSISDGSNANSLGYDKNVFCSYGDNEEIIHFISHEVGTHILVDELVNLWSSLGDTSSDENTPSFLYAAYENLIQYYNQKVLSDYDLKYTLGDNYNSDKFHEIYLELDKDANIYSAKDMIISAMNKIKNCS
ncbi:hypothetical protein RJG79_03025 [Mycoplasmatota bacterium WC44]